MASTAKQVNSKTVSEVRNCAVSFAGKIDASELLTGVPVVTATPAGLTFSDEIVNTAEIEINEKDIPIGEAIQFKAIGGTAGTTYTISVSCGTTSTPAQTLYGKCLLEVEAD